MALPLPSSTGLMINDLPRHLASTAASANRIPPVTSLIVTKSELRAAIDAAPGGDYAQMLRSAPAVDKSTTMARTLMSAMGAVAQPEYDGTRPTGRFLTGVEGAKALLEGFGDRQRVRTIRLDPQKLSSLHAALPPLSRERLSNDLGAASKISSERDILGPALAPSEVARLRSDGYGR